MTVRVFVIEKGETKEWSGLCEDDRDRISRGLNRQALTALGYEAEKERKSETKIK
ncbi:MAG: hypothetical protein HDT13_05375 [Butyrivibrio sp.]|nr:hypothetical protein [Butyrivibrio sp.]